MPKSADLFVDTAGWGYYVHSRDPLHLQTVGVIQNALRRRRRLITSNYILAELVTILDRYRITRQRIMEAINAIIADPHIEIFHIDLTTDAEAWALLNARLDKQWSLVDAASMVIMQRYGLTEIVTTDHHFSQAGFVRLIGTLP